VNESFTYGDALNRLTSYTVSAQAIPNLSRTVDLRYNAVGQLLSKSDVGTYSYPAPGGAAGSKPHAPTSVAGSYNAGYTYDDNGNVITATNGKYRSVKYTSFDQPDGGEGLQGPSGSPKYTWQYDENHARVSETRVNASGTRTTWYVGGNFESETAPGGAVSNRHMLSVGGQVIGVLVSSGALPASSTDITQNPPASVSLVKVEYWHKDHKGSLISTTDHTGAVTARYAYDPFGKRRYTNGIYDANGNVVVDWSPTLNAGTGNGFSGAEQLDDVGVVHMNGRLFDPMLGVFMQPNPSVNDAGHLQSFNRYSYCENNPLTCTDPTGLQGVRPLLSVSAISLAMRQGAMVRVAVHIYSASSGLAFAGAARPLTVQMCGDVSCVSKMLTPRIQYTDAEIANISAMYAAQAQAQFMAEWASRQQAQDWYRNYREAQDISANQAAFEFDKAHPPKTIPTNQDRPQSEAHLGAGGTVVADVLPQNLNHSEDSSATTSAGTGDSSSTSSGGGDSDTASSAGRRSNDQTGEKKYTVNTKFETDSSGNLTITITGTRWRDYAAAQVWIMIGIAANGIPFERPLIWGYRGFQGFRAALAARAAVRGPGITGSFFRTVNAAGGEVLTSVGTISQDSFANYVYYGLEKGTVDILTGVHGEISGAMRTDLSMYADDVARFGGEVGVTVHNVAEMTRSEIKAVLEKTGTIIGGFCNSGVCLLGK
jgi:RHS repeat-associated protein